MRTYVAFCDPSGGSSDSMTLAVAHKGLFGWAVLDGYWERRPPFSPDDCVREFSETLKSYGISSVVGDKYAAQWTVERFREHEITYKHSALTKSEIFTTFVALLNSGKVKLPSDKKLKAQFESLERCSSRTGRDVIEHPPSGHDDVCNAAAGALVLASAVSRKCGWEGATVIYVPRERPGEARHYEGEGERERETHWWPMR